MKIMIIGYSGSGKSTLAARIAKAKELPVLHLDQVHFLDGWKERNRTDALNIVKEVLAEDSWVIDGNYAKFYHQERLEQADKIIFMNFSRWDCLRRVRRRYQQYKGTTRPDMAAGCEEKLDFEFVWWILYQGRTKKKQEFQEIMEQYSEKMVLLRNQAELDEFVQAFLEE